MKFRRTPASGPVVSWTCPSCQTIWRGGQAACAHCLTRRAQERDVIAADDAPEPLRLTQRVHAGKEPVRRPVTKKAPHYCHAHACGNRVPARMLFCREHWNQLSRSVQVAIWREYRPGQEREKNPSASYLAVQRFAVARVAFRPHDERAAEVSARYMAQALHWREKARAQGEPDPLRGLTPPEASPS